MARDFQRSKVYRCDAVMQVNDMRFKDLQTSRGFCEVVLWHPDVMAAFPFATPGRLTVWVNNAETWAGCVSESDGTARISLPKNGTGFRDSLLLHEMAHWFTSLNHRNKDIAPHGPEYAGIHLWLVGVIQGRARQIVMEQTYVKYGVRFKSLLDKC